MNKNSSLRAWDVISLREALALFGDADLFLSHISTDALDIKPNTYGDASEAEDEDDSTLVVENMLSGAVIVNAVYSRVGTSTQVIKCLGLVIRRNDEQLGGDV